MKKIISIIGIILAILLIIFLVWFVLIRDRSIPAGDAVRDLLPFGSGNGFDIPGFVDNDDAGSDSEFFDNSGAPINPLFPVTTSPVAGMVAFSRGADTVVRYVERATGHIYEVVLPNRTERKVLEKVKITNTTLPKIYEAYFRPDGGAAVLRSLRADTDIDVASVITLIPPTGTSSTTSDGTYTFSSVSLRGDIGSMAVSGNNIYYSSLDSKVVTSTQFSNTSSNTLLSSLFTDWKIIPFGSSILLQTKIDEDSPGYVFSIGSGSVLNKILGPLFGLSATANSSGNRIIYSHLSDGRVKTASRNLQNGVEVPISPTTLAEKCVWSNTKTGVVYCGVPIDSIVPGQTKDWYLGYINFSDRVWMFDTVSEIASVLIEPEPLLGLSVDVMEPKLSPQEDYLIFINKTDLSLWALKLQ